MLDENKLQQLLFECAEQRQAALSELYTLTSPKLYGVARRLLQSHHQAAKALQEAFVYIWYRAFEYTPDQGRPFAWMTSIVRNQALRLMRLETSQQKRHHSLLGEREVYMRNDRFFDEYQARSNPLLRELQGCLDELEPSQRHAILLSYYYGYSQYEMVNKLKHPVGTLRAWIRRGIKRVRSECDADQ
ncbi:sigma-70 family RNA polymerase sigma factor [Thiomicrorhabdus sp. 6S3-12]|uniref:sigma-70 family RNA polymerase sigma factor n=1 Tax=Thiomicrorhabdus sp. 6S3-12 TaxID=2819681 RepID=UPI001AACABBF|nr:sigma-70 family RNA polymerase sigma factor [Thiomicrorhabdus sp. 6S3-12]MBO1924223.1 sigma-70 family RNA polymerase sigma factor [Thiomicrorhabdus sp. 6S3-12]